MFSLIITIISIALVVALVAATMYYGGSALNQGTDSADAAGLVSGAQQIVAAATLYQNLEPSTAPAPTVANLVSEKYLSTIPVTVAGTDWTLDSAARTLEIEEPKASFSNDLCKKLIDAANPMYKCIQGAADTDPNTFTFTYR